MQTSTHAAKPARTPAAIELHPLPALSTVVYGPAGCGKTRNAKRIAQALHLQEVIDGWEIGCGAYWPRTGALLLTNTPPPAWFRQPVLSFDEAMARVA